MCLCIKKSDNEQIAEEDIVCYKLLIECYDKKSKSTVFKSIRGTYQLNTLYRLRKKLKPDNNILQEFGINKGYHSYDKEGAIVAKKHALSFRKIYKCIIPKGAKYYKGVHNNREYTGYVSTSIKVIEQVNRKSLLTR